MSDTVLRLTAAAQERFGEVLSITPKTREGDFRLFIRRIDPVFPEAPFMSITGYMKGNEALFVWGHYDLTEERMKQVMKEGPQS